MCPAKRLPSTYASNSNMSGEPRDAAPRSHVSGVASESILVTGAAGWTARAIIDRLQTAGNRVIGLDLPCACPPRAGWIGADVADLASVEVACAGEVSAVVHLAVAVGQG